MTVCVIFENGRVGREPDKSPVSLFRLNSLSVADKFSTLKLNLFFYLITLIVREEDDTVVGFGISLPSLSHALQKAKGRLFPFGFIPLLKAMHSKTKIVDLYLMGILPEYQNKGVNALLFCDLIPEYIKLGAEYAESNIELETNTAVQAQWDYFKREHHKTRRVFIKKLI